MRSKGYEEPQASDFMQKIEDINAASKYQKRESPQKRTMSVPEMRHLLGLGKTESYWLIHKHYFDTVLVAGQMRVDIESFEKWYANQVKHKKVDGQLPGQELDSYSPQEIAAMLGVHDTVVYEQMKIHNIETVMVDHWKRIPKDAFEKWYSGQSRYRTQEDREKDAAIEEASIWIPDVARLLGIKREQAYQLVYRSKYRDLFEVIVVAERKRITKESFDRFLNGQDTYKLTKTAMKRELKTKTHSEAGYRTKNANATASKKEAVKKYLTVQEAAVLSGLSRSRISQYINDGNIPYKKTRSVVRIPRIEFEAWLRKRKEYEYGIY